MARVLAAAITLAFGASILLSATGQVVQASDIVFDRHEKLAKVNTWGKVRKGAFFANEFVDNGYEVLKLQISAKKKAGVQGYCRATVGLWDFYDDKSDPEPWVMQQKARIATKYTKTFKHKFVTDIRIGNSDIEYGMWQYLDVLTNGKCKNVRASLTRNVYVYPDW